MLSGDKCLLNVSQMMAVHCLLFLENGDMYRGVVFLHLARSVNPPRPSGARPQACYPVFTSEEQNRTSSPAPTAPSRVVRRSDCIAYFS